MCGRSFKQHPSLEGVVLLIDALGVKGIWKREEPYSVLKRWDKLIGHVFYAPKLFYSAANDDAAPGATWEVNVFSDTIIVTGIVDKTRMFGHDFFILHDGVQAAGMFIKFGLDLGFKLRGAISYGPVFRYQRMILGPAIDEAAGLYEVAKWVGVVLGPSAKKVAEDYVINTSTSQQHFQKDILTEWKVPMKGGTFLDTLVVGWPLFANNGFPQDYDFSKKAQRHIRSQLRDMETGDEAIRMKFRNTWEFYLAYVQFYNESKSGTAIELEKFKRQNRNAKR